MASAVGGIVDIIGVMWLQRRAKVAEVEELDFIGKTLSETVNLSSNRVTTHKVSDKV